MLTDDDEINNLYRGPSNDDSCQVSVHLAKEFQRRKVFLEINQLETRIACGGDVLKQIGTKLATVMEGFP